MGNAKIQNFFELESEDWLKKYNFPDELLKKIMKFRSRQINSLDSEQLKRVPIPRYIPSGKELIRAAAALLYGEKGEKWEAPLLIGPRGSGKSTLAETLAAILLMPVTKIFGGIDIDAEALLGSRTIALKSDNDNDVNDKSGLKHEMTKNMYITFEPGLLLRAVQSGEMLIVDEVNMLVPEVTSILHGLLDWQKCLSVPGYKMVHAHPSFRLVGCMNYGYVGTKNLNESFQDRFRSIFVPYLPKESLSELLALETGCSTEIADTLSELFYKLAERVENGDLSDKVLSVRALYRSAREYQYGIGSLKEIVISTFTEGLNDQFESEQVIDIIDALIE
ncbi:AAA family ATPase [Peptococcaceae bacterium]|nr:AAA family ATPase [Peptococcaceae bacterium]